MSQRIQFLRRIFAIFFLTGSFTASNTIGQETDLNEKLAEAIIEQMPAHLGFESVEISDSTDQGNAMIAVVSHTLKIQATLKENLYHVAGNANGKTLLQIATPSGQSVEVVGKAIATTPKMKIAGMESSIQVFVLPYQSQQTGLLLSRFPQNNYAISSSSPQTAAASPSSSTVATPALQQAASPTSDAFERLLSIFKSKNEIWGTNNSRNGLGTPIILKALERKSSDLLVGEFYRPYDQTVQPFELKALDKRYALTIKPSNTHSRQEIYPIAVEDNFLKGNVAPQFPLTISENQALKDAFTAKLTPWAFDGTPSDYVQVNGQLVELETLEVAVDDWVSVPARLIEEKPDRFINPQSNWSLVQTPFGALSADSLETVEPRFRKSFHPLKEKRNAWASPDRQQHILLKNGDLWKGKIDWENNTTREEVNVTNIELLIDCEPITWYGEVVYLRNNSSRDKPIIRIGLEDGSIQELAEEKALAYYAYGSPDGRFLFSSDGHDGLLHVFDAADETYFTMEATRDQRMYGGTRRERPMPVSIQPTKWINAHTFLTQWGWFDLDTREKLLYTDFTGITDRLPVVPRVNRAFTIPGHEYLDVVVSGVSEIENGQGKVGTDATLRFRINRRTREVVEIPLEFEAYGVGSEMVWIDQDRYLFYRNGGGLSEVGVWIYDVLDGTHKRLTPFFPNGQARAQNETFLDQQDIELFTEFHQDANFLVIAEKNLCLFRYKKGTKDELMVIDISTNKLRRVPYPTKDKNRGGYIRQILDKPLSLFH